MNPPEQPCRFPRRGTMPSLGQPMLGQSMLGQPTLRGGGAA